MAVATVYDSQRDYIKHLKSKALKEEGDCGCKDAAGEDCGCCPPGLVAIFDDAGHNIGCLTPNDAELYETNLQKCEQGYVKLIRNSDGVFLGCVSEDKFEELYESVNGSLS
jgi:hypothetical protein